ncbi:hypothetical protein [Glaciimonas immobilis]|uniref:Uncharacterized protein n=1 Tax=Glaciimonas immobilis TaxID=728004 RepID=A0A840RNC3_9BURK|nr:hypothetical protein [Glaciimonas immobilis]KAF3997002.1 hypothetical protein HAV38_15085 [Glaciimonas immobilis]MBB5199837.1 hypothetical protein [Glaciimonas immobilis]
MLRIETETPDLLRGILKIAIEYAISKGIAPSLLKPLMPQGTVVAVPETLRAHVKQYYPTSDEEKLYEAYKFEHENGYPNHQLYLFNIGYSLYCYAELFGTIQKYVLLSSDYRGEPIREKYLQRCTRWNFDEKQWICRSTSDLAVVASELNVDVRGKMGNVIQKEILDAARSRDYLIDPDEQIEKVKMLVLNLAQYKLVKIKGYPAVDQMMKKAEAAKLNFTFELADRLHDNPLKALSLLRHDFNDFRITNEGKSCPDAADEIAATSKQAYASYKLFEFLVALDKQHILEFKAIEDAV